VVAYSAEAYTIDKETAAGCLLQAVLTSNISKVASYVYETKNPTGYFRTACGVFSFCCPLPHL